MTVRELINQLQAVVDHEAIVVMACNRDGVAAQWPGHFDPPRSPPEGGNEVDMVEFADIDPDTLGESPTPTGEQAVILYAPYAPNRP